MRTKDKDSSPLHVEIAHLEGVGTRAVLLQVVHEIHGALPLCCLLSHLVLLGNSIDRHFGGRLPGEEAIALFIEGASARRAIQTNGQQTEHSSMESDGCVSVAVLPCALFDHGVPPAGNPSARWVGPGRYKLFRVSQRGVSLCNHCGV